jgi:hypothetical protein
MELSPSSEATQELPSIEKRKKKMETAGIKYLRNAACYARKGQIRIIKLWQS